MFRQEHETMLENILEKNKDLENKLSLKTEALKEYNKFNFDISKELEEYKNAYVNDANISTTQVGELNKIIHDNNKK